MATQVMGQIPTIEWQKSLGGSGGEAAACVIQTTDGGYALAGYSFSNDGDVSGNHGDVDYWVMKLNSAGIIEWQKSFGGTNYDLANSIIQTSDGGYAVAGHSASNDGDVSGNHGFDDCWVVKLSSTGAIEWQKSLGGSNTETAYSIIQTSDGGYALAGWSGSNNGDVSGNHGIADYWVVKLSSTGTIQWQKSFGGSYNDLAYSIIQTTDGGYIVAGGSDSNDGDVSGNHGGEDYWVVKLTGAGAIEWQKSLGGGGYDAALSIIKTTDGGYAVAGRSNVNGGDVSGNHESLDYWIVKLSSTGTIQWQKSLGGASEDIASSIIQTTDGGYVVAGLSQSNDGDVNGNHGVYFRDYWVVKLTGAGTIQWQKALGGALEDIASSIIQTSDGGYVVAGNSHSNDGDVSGNHGLGDYWIVKLSTAPFSVSPKNLQAVCTNAATVTATGCAGTVTWYRDVTGAGTNNVVIGTGNSLNYTIGSELNYYLRATCTVGGVASGFSNYSIIHTGPIVNPESYITSAGAPVSLTASGCPVGTSYLWGTGETTPTVTKSPAVNTNYTVKCTGGACQSTDGIGYVYVGNVMANNDTYTLNIDTPLSGNVCTNDDPIAPRTIIIAEYPTHGGVTYDNTGLITYTPAPNYTGQDSFKYYATTGSGTYSNYATVTLNVICPTAVVLQPITHDIIAGRRTIKASASNGTLVAANAITGAANVTYEARSIQLNAGFKAIDGTVFLAQIGGCN